MSDDERPPDEPKPLVPGDRGAIAPPGLSASERTELDTLHGRVRNSPYPALLGLEWEADPVEVNRRARALGEWLEAIVARPGLDAHTRAQTRECLEHVDLARRVLTHAELRGPYLRAARARHEPTEGPHA